MQKNQESILVVLGVLILALVIFISVLLARSYFASQPSLAGEVSSACRIVTENDAQSIFGAKPTMSRQNPSGEQGKRPFGSDCTYRIYPSENSAPTHDLRFDVRFGVKVPDYKTAVAKSVENAKSADPYSEVISLGDASVWLPSVHQLNTYVNTDVFILQIQLNGRQLSKDEHVSVMKQLLPRMSAKDPNSAKQDNSKALLEPVDSASLKVDEAHNLLTDGTLTYKVPPFKKLEIDVSGLKRREKFGELVVKAEFQDKSCFFGSSEADSLVLDSNSDCIGSGPENIHSYFSQSTPFKEGDNISLTVYVKFPAASVTWWSSGMRISKDFNTTMAVDDESSTYTDKPRITADLSAGYFKKDEGILQPQSRVAIYDTVAANECFLISDGAEIISSTLPLNPIDSDKVGSATFKIALKSPEEYFGLFGFDQLPCLAPSGSSNFRIYTKPLGPNTPLRSNERCKCRNQH